MSARVQAAVFADEGRLLAALSDARALGLDVVDVRSPYPVHGVDELLGVRRSRLPLACLVGGVTGLAGALVFQAWTSAVDWPLDVGGKPWNSLPAFAPVAFEVTVLLAGLATVFGLLVRSGLVPWSARQPLDLGATDDRFALLFVRRDMRASDAALADLWSRHGASRVVDVGEERR